MLPLLHHFFFYDLPNLLIYFHFDIEMSHSKKFKEMSHLMQLLQFHLNKCSYLLHAYLFIRHFNIYFL